MQSIGQGSAAIRHKIAKFTIPKYSHAGDFSRDLPRTVYTLYRT